MIEAHQENNRLASKRYCLERFKKPQQERAVLRPDAIGKEPQGTGDFKLELPAEVADAANRAAAGDPFLRWVIYTAGLAFALARYCDCNRIIVASPSLRRQSGAPNTLLHVIEVDSARPFTHFLAATRDSMAEDYRHASYPFPVLLADYGFDEASHGWFDVVIANRDLHNEPQPAGQSVTVVFDHSGSRETVHCVFDRTVHQERGLRHLLELVWTSLQRALDNPGAPLGQVGWLNDSHCEQVLHIWNDTAVQLPAATADDLIAGQARRVPSSIAVRFPARQMELSYAELEGRANRLARFLVARGVEPETAVGVRMSRSLELLITILAILKAGGVYVPLDPASPRQRLQRILADAAVKLVVSDSESGYAMDGLAAPILTVDAAEMTQPEEIALPLRHPDQLAYILYTSGSTGQPKGVMVSHRNLVNYLEWARRTYFAAGENGAPLVTSAAYDLSVTTLLGPLVAGQAVTIVEELPGLDSTAQALRARPGFSLLKLTPSHLAALKETMSATELEFAAQTLVLGGEALRGNLIQDLRVAGSGITIYNEYGPTETTVGSLAFACREGDGLPASIPIGRPIGNTRVYLLDRDLQPVPDEMPGEIYIAGAGVARGYRNSPGQTASVFVPDPFSRQAGERMYRTGDLAWRKAGALEYLGRKTRQTKVRGYRVEPGEIEVALLAMPSIVAAAVTPRKNPQGDQTLAAFLVVQGNGPSYSEVRSHLRSLLPEYMIPSVLIRMDKLPMSPSGKVDYDRLPAQETNARTQARGPSQPSNGTTEQALLVIWRELLGAPEAGVLDNFFELGGDSILAIRMAARARRVGVVLQPGAVFENPTIVQLASVAEDLQAPNPMTDEGGRAIPLTPIQHWFFEHYADCTDGFCQTRSLRLNQRLTAVQLETALVQLAQRHDALRLRFHKTGDGWTQSQCSEETSRLVEEVADEAAITEARTGCMQRLSISNGPLLQALLINVADERQELFLAIHHLAVDHLSWLPLLDDLEFLLRHPGTTLAPVSLSFARAAQLLPGRLQEAIEPDARDYWVRQTAPSDGLDVGAEASSERLLVSLTEGETRALLREVHATFNTGVQDFLTTALCRAFSRMLGWSKVRVELELNGRPMDGELDLSGTVGWFTALFPIELEASSETDPCMNLIAVKDELRRVPNGGAAYGALRYLGSSDCREALNQPVPMVSFNYLGPAHHETSPDSLFEPLPENQRPWRPASARRVYRYEVTSIVGDSRLLTEFVWSSERDSRKAVESLSAVYLEELRQLIEACKEREGPGCTPADFRHVSLDATSLDAILSQLGSQERAVYEPSSH